MQFEIVDGLQNILPAGTPGVVQSGASNLVNAYKWPELVRRSRVAIYTLYAGISDRAEPCESLRANVVYGLGLERATVLLSSLQLDDFRRGAELVPEVHKRGIRGCYFLGARLELPRGGMERWKIVADVERNQAQVVDLIRSLADPGSLRAAVEDSVAAGRDEAKWLTTGSSVYTQTPQNVASRGAGVQQQPPPPQPPAGTTGTASSGPTRTYLQGQNIPGALTPAQGLMEDIRKMRENAPGAEGWSLMDTANARAPQFDLK